MKFLYTDIRSVDRNSTIKSDSSKYVVFKDSSSLLRSAARQYVYTDRYGVKYSIMPEGDAVAVYSYAKYGDNKMSTDNAKKIVQDCISALQEQKGNAGMIKELQDMLQCVR